MLNDEIESPIHCTKPSQDPSTQLDEAGANPASVYDDDFDGDVTESRTSTLTFSYDGDTTIVDSRKRRLTGSVHRSSQDYPTSPVLKDCEDEPQSPAESTKQLVAPREPPPTGEWTWPSAWLLKGPLEMEVELFTGESGDFCFLVVSGACL